MNSTDQEIIEKMQSNPGVGMKLLMDTYQERLYWHIRRLVVSHDDAQDLLQETFSESVSLVLKFQRQQFVVLLALSGGNQCYAE